MEHSAPATLTSNIELVEATQRGDLNAFNELARRHERFVFSIALSRLRHFHDAEDETQNVLIDAFQRIHKLDDPRKFCAWLRRLTLNHCVDRVRRAKAERSATGVVRDCAQPPVSDGIVPTLSPEIRMSLTRLSATLRVTVELFYLQECSIKEISSRLCIPVSSVKRRLHVARKKLRAFNANHVQHYENSNLAANHLSRSNDSVTHMTMNNKAINNA